MLAIKCFAGAKRDEGRLYLASLIHLYVSLRFVVSNGGLPNSIVYLFKSKGNQSYFFYLPTILIWRIFALGLHMYKGLQTDAVLYPL